MSTKRDTSQIYNTISVLLAEKRTSLAVLRTAIAIFTLPILDHTIREIKMKKECMHDILED